MENQVLDIVCDDYLEKYGKELIINKTHIVGGGCISHTQVINSNEGNFFLKWNQHVAPDLFVKEAEGLNEMASISNEFLKVPEVILFKEVNQTPGYILMEYFPAGIVSNQEEKLGRGLAILHQKTSNQFGFYHDNYCGSTKQPNEWNPDWVKFFGENRILYLVEEIRKSCSISSDEIDSYHRLVDRLPELIGNNHQACLIHGDLWSGNYMYTSHGPVIIDPATYYAVPEMELSIMTMFGGFSNLTWGIYLEISNLEASWQERVQLYQIYHILNHYYLFGGGYGAQAISAAKKFL